MLEDRFKFYIESRVPNVVFTAEKSIQGEEVFYVVSWLTTDFEILTTVYSVEFVKRFIKDGVWILIEKSIKFENAKLGEVYRIIPNRESYYGKCADIIQIENQLVVIVGIGERHREFTVCSGYSSHTVRCENLGLLDYKRKYKF